MVLEINNLTKKYVTRTALDAISFGVEKGEVIGFLGPNGAGKTTTMNIITGYLAQTSGEVNIASGCRIGYLPEHPPLYPDMTVREFLEFVYELKRVTIPSEKHIAEVVEMAKIGDVENRIIKRLSKGYRQRIGLAQALIGYPEIIILDEPTIGLDPKQISEFRTLVRTLAGDHTIILSSHILQEIEAVATRVLIVNQGKLVANGTISELTGNGKESLEEVFLRVTQEEVSA